MKVGSLFSGIGGFDKGLEDAGYEIAWQVEIDPYCQRVLAKHWPTVPRYGDITTIDWTTVPRVDLLCGGFPCQDLSFAGKRAGIDGARSGLWSEYVRAIVQLRPRYVLVENVPGLLTNPYMGRVLGDLAACGYDAEWDCLSAGEFGAPHLRERIWLCAYSKSNGLEKKSYFDSLCKQGDSIICDVAVPPLPMWDESAPPRTSFCGVRDGIPARVDRLKGLGNAVVPQIVEALGRMILEADGSRSATTVWKATGT